MLWVGLVWLKLLEDRLIAQTYFVDKMGNVISG